MGELRQRDAKRLKFIKSQGYDVEIKWECDFVKDLKTNPEMAAFVTSLNLQDPLNPRDAFFGGRTNAIKLYHEAAADEKILYKDVTSLYPWTNKYKKYPLGHPEIITKTFKSIEKYEGLVKCTILPPKNLFHPILPYRTDKLTFPLCRTCADEMIQEECHHCDAERQLTGTWVTLEVQEALKHGYQMIEIHEVWHYDKVSVYDPDTKTGGLFTDYTNTWMKLKQEASGYPEKCKTVESKQNYIESYYQREGIRLDPANIKKNPGLRSLAKLMLNSFWGKFGQRSNMSKHLHVTDAAEYFKLLLDDTIVVQEVLMLPGDEALLVQYKKKDEMVEELSNTNVVIAAYTTCHARLKLYTHLKAMGENILYFDTDSVIYVLKGDDDDLPTGNYLGDLTDELDGGSITIFASGGPKNYCYRYKTKEGDVKSKAVLKGITQNYQSSMVLNADVVMEMVKTCSHEKVTVNVPYKIHRNKLGKVTTKAEAKDYRRVYTKRRVLADGYSTVPYGYLADC